jgi:hypothetical protein
MGDKIEVGKNFGGINYFNRIAKNPSYLAVVVNAIAKLPLDNTADISSLLPFEIEEKINHNNVVIYKRIIEGYAFYTTLINNTYETISEVNPNIRDKIMKVVKRKYEDAKNHLVKENLEESEINIIRDNSDEIIKEVISVLEELLYESANFSNEVPIEDLEIALEIIIGDAFFNCKILENPNS